MSVLRIRVFGDPVLRSPAGRVSEFDPKLAKLAEDMLETMNAAPGVGLAAPQVGIPRRLLVFDDGERSGALCNPSIVWHSTETQTGEEGCLSVPGIYFPVTRALGIKVMGQDLDGHQVEVEGEGFLARILAHEIDHLDGVLFMDRLATAERHEAMRMIREAQLGVMEATPRPAKAL